MNFFSKCFLSNVEEINSLLSFLKTLWNNNFVFFCYLTASNQLKCGIIYEKIAMRVGDDEQRINDEWPYWIWICLINFSEY